MHSMSQIIKHIISEVYVVSYYIFEMKNSVHLTNFQQVRFLLYMSYPCGCTYKHQMFLISISRLPIFKKSFPIFVWKQHFSKEAQRTWPFIFTRAPRALSQKRRHHGVTSCLYLTSSPTNLVWRFVYIMRIYKCKFCLIPF